MRDAATAYGREASSSTFLRGIHGGSLGRSSDAATVVALINTRFGQGFDALTQMGLVAVGLAEKLEYAATRIDQVEAVLGSR